LSGNLSNSANVAEHRLQKRSNDLIQRMLDVGVVIAPSRGIDETIFADSMNSLPT
jgi:hypothetical protein